MPCRTSTIQIEALRVTISHVTHENVGSIVFHGIRNRLKFCQSYLNVFYVAAADYRVVCSPSCVFVRHELVRPKNTSVLPRTTTAIVFQCSFLPRITILLVCTIFLPWHTSFVHSRRNVCRLFSTVALFPVDLLVVYVFYFSIHFSSIYIFPLYGGYMRQMSFLLFSK